MKRTAAAISSGVVPRRSGIALALPAELLVALARAGQGRAGSDAVDADARRQRQRHGLGQRPQPGLAQRVGDEMRREVPHPLVEDVDDRAVAVRRKPAREFLHQHEGRAQIGLDDGGPSSRASPSSASSRSNTEALLTRQPSGPSARDRRAAPAPPSPPRRARSAASATARPPPCSDLADQRLGRLARAMVMHRHRPAVGRERQRDGAADALRAAGDERGARDGTDGARSSRRHARRRARTLALAIALAEVPARPPCERPAGRGCRRPGRGEAEIELLEPADLVAQRAPPPRIRDRRRRRACASRDRRSPP